jgi:hypothetical protein
MMAVLPAPGSLINMEFFRCGGFLLFRQPPSRACSLGEVFGAVLQGFVAVFCTVDRGGTAFAQGNGLRGLDKAFGAVGVTIDLILEEMIW